MDKKMLVAVFGLMGMLSCTSTSSHESSTKGADTATNVTTNEVSDVPKPAATTTVPVKEKSSEDKAIDLVMQLDEVVQLGKQIEVGSKGKANLFASVMEEPSDDQEYYWIAVGQSDELKHTNLLHFYVYPDFSIRYYDVIEDVELTLAEWRKMK